jgi:beta-lactamase regulating signal transducer with metallopeptidase domain
VTIPIPAGASPVVGLLAAWLATYALHSTLVLAIAWTLSRAVRSLPWRDLFWKVALAGGVATATVQLGALALLPPAAELPATAQAAHSAAVAPWDAAAAGPVSHRVVLAPSAVARVAGEGWALFLVAAWAVGAVWRLAALGRGRRRLLRALGPRTPLCDGPYAATLERLRRQAGVRRRVRLTSSPLLQTPVALAGEVCIPEGSFERLTSEQQESILAHELAHVMRGDPRWFALGEVVRAVFFFQPLNGTAMRKLKENSEFLCDDAAVRQTGKQGALAECLAELAARVAAPRPSFGTALGGERGSLLVQRVARVLSAEAGRAGPVPRAASALAALAMMGVVAGFAPGVAAPASAAPSPFVPPLTAAPTPQPEESQMRLRTLFQPGLEWNSETTGQRSHRGTVESRFTLSAKTVMVHRSRPEIVDVRPGGHLRIREERGDRVLELEVTPGPRYVFRENGVERPVDARVRAWLATYLRQHGPRH